MPIELLAQLREKMAMLQRASWRKAQGVKIAQIPLVAGGRFELYSAYPIQVPAVPATVIATG